MDAGLVDEQSAQIMVTTIEAERGGEALVNEHDGLDMENGFGDGGGDDARPLAKLNARQLEELLHERERQMRQGGPDGEETDQWRVYKEIVHALAGPTRLRMMVQASAGTGKSFLLTSVYLWCLVKAVSCLAAAPTGIGDCFLFVRINVC